jgi:hypothetical protein
VNLGFGNNTVKPCQKSDLNGMAVHAEVDNTTVVKANWDCATDNCFGCFFRVNNVGIDNCHEHKDNIRITFTRTIEEVKIDEERIAAITDENLIYMAVGSALILVTMLFIVAILIYRHKNDLKSKLTWTKLDMDFSGKAKNFIRRLKEIVAKHFGLR